MVRPPESRKRRRYDRGLTLMELMVAMAILAGLLGVSFYSLGMIGQTDARSQAMRLTSAIKYTWNQAAMKNAQYRMVFDLDQQTYHTEVTSSPVVSEESDLNSEEEEESEKYLSEAARRAGQAQETSSAQDGSESGGRRFNVGNKPTYEEVEDSVVKKHTLPKRMKIERVTPCDRETPIESGRAAIHFFPNGFMEPAIIVLSHGTTKYSLRTEPLTGQVKITAGELEKTEDCGKPHEVQEEW